MLVTVILSTLLHLFFYLSKYYLDDKLACCDHFQAITLLFPFMYKVYVIYSVFSVYIDIASWIMDSPTFIL